MWTHHLLCALLALLGLRANAQLVAFTPTSAFPNRLVVLFHFLFSPTCCLSVSAVQPSHTQSAPLPPAPPPIPSPQVRAQRVLAGGVRRVGHHAVELPAGEPVRQRQQAHAHGFRGDELYGYAEQLRARGVLLVPGRDGGGDARPGGGCIAAECS
jgi:hypothetical protein